MRRTKHLFIGILLTFTGFGVIAQQVPDYEFDPVILKPAYEKCKGPLVLIDEAHHNFHTMGERYFGFSKALSKDGYRVRQNKTAFTVIDLHKAKILVIANAVHISNKTDWSLPNPSAFTTTEIEEIVKWVQEGGSLFLIADHMPMPGAADNLAKKFGFTFYNGFATDTTTGLFPGKKKEMDVFRKSTGTLATHSITNGIDGIVTFTGQAFQVPQEAISLLNFDDKYKILLPDTAWRFNQDTERLSVNGFSQGAVMKFGKGRIAVFGEAAMFTAQRKGIDKIPFGLNSEEAPQNLSFLLNLVHWLDQKESAN